ncbi:unannotated protein [freshwater metagenome]|uniref:Unannotated protein n=1 Tax=freshwater metagenome TaxID=449393 RepID=A0A6J5YG39_9ZZZZ
MSASSLGSSGTANRVGCVLRNVDASGQRHDVAVDDDVDVDWSGGGGAVAVARSDRSPRATTIAATMPPITSSGNNSTPSPIISMPPNPAGLREVQEITMIVNLRRPDGGNATAGSADSDETGSVGQLRGRVRRRNPNRRSPRG